MSSTRARHAVAILATTVLAVGCGSDANTAASGDPTPTTSAGPVANTFHVDVDANTADNALGKTVNATAYYPKSLQVHPGDTVVFDLQDSGDPHTVAVGALIDTAAAAVKAAEAKGGSEEGPPPPEVLAVPQLLPEGPGDAIQAGAQPCFQATGKAPLKDACPVKAGEFTGAESLVSSGWLAGDAPFSLKIGSAAKPGTFTFFCQLHGASMQGSLTIVDAATPIPTPEEVRATAAKEIAAELVNLQPAMAQLAAATSAKPLAGALSPKSMAAYVAAFAPEIVKVPVGGTVTWQLQGVHAIAMEAPADAQAVRQAAPDGSVHVNTKVVAPVGGPGFGEKPGLVKGGSYAGGFRNSGIGFSFPPAFSSYSLTFNKAGTFTVLCGIHEGMKGQVVVG